MRLIIHRFTIVTVCLLAPFSAVASDLSSENFVVSGAAVAPTGRTSPATSTNYSLQYEGGGLYTVDTEGTGEEEDDDDVTSGSRIRRDSASTNTTEYIPPNDPAISELPTPPTFENDELSPNDSSQEGTKSETSGTGGLDRDTGVVRAGAEEITDTIQSVSDYFRGSLLSPLVMSVAHAVGLLGGLLLTLFNMQRIPFSITNLSSLFTHGWSNVFGFLFFWKSRRAWGTVYDSKTKLPLDPAYVELFTEQGEKMGEAITDLDGRYGFLVPAGMYAMKVQKAHYAFPSANVAITGRDVLYSNLYYGGPLEVSDVVVHDIPMDPLEFDWNQYEKLRTNQLRFIHEYDPLVARALGVLFHVGLFLSLWQLYLAQTPFTIAMMLVYLFLFALRIAKGKPVLYGVVKKGLFPLQFALVRIFRDQDQVAARVTDQFGRYVAIVVPGVYTIRVEERVSEGQYAPIKEITLKTSDGIINPRIQT